MNNIFNVQVELKTALETLGLPVYLDIKDEAEVNSHIILTYMPLKKDLNSSINDIIVLLYLKKESGCADNAVIEDYKQRIESIVNSAILTNEIQEPFTRNFDKDFTLTTFNFKTFIY